MKPVRGCVARVLACLLLCFFVTTASWSAERLTIGQLHKYHASYQLHSVTLVGAVRSMHVFPPLPVPGSDRCSPLYGIAEFELEDDTGSLSVETIGSCFAAAMELPRDGDLIELTAEIQVFASDDQIARAIKAIAQKIVVVKPAGEVK